MPEFSPQVIDALRQPLESREIVIARANHRIAYPTRIQLVTAMNPCRCGHAGEPGFTCRQGAACKDRYLARLSGPILDRIDIRLSVPAVTTADLARPPAREGSNEVRERIIAARCSQWERYQTVSDGEIKTNAECPPALLDSVAAPDSAGEKLLQDAASAFCLSARGYHRTLRLARTLADLDREKNILSMHIAEALTLRGTGLNAAARAVAGRVRDPAPALPPM